MRQMANKNKKSKFVQGYAKIDGTDMYARHIPAAVFY